jgi:hypothetical protein
MLVYKPCKGCPDRSTGKRTTDCHTTCERYAAFQEAKAAESKARREYSQVRGAQVEGRLRLKENPPSRRNDQR